MQKNKNTKPRILKPGDILLISTFAVFVIAQIYFALQTATSGARLSKLESEEVSLSDKNRSLSSQLVELTSLTKASDQSTNLGFVKPQKILFAQGESFVAKLP